MGLSMGVDRIPRTADKQFLVVTHVAEHLQTYQFCTGARPWDIGTRADEQTERGETKEETVTVQ